MAYPGDPVRIIGLSGVEGKIGDFKVTTEIESKEIKKESEVFKPIEIVEDAEEEVNDVVNVEEVEKVKLSLNTAKV